MLSKIFVRYKSKFFYEILGNNSNGNLLSAIYVWWKLVQSSETVQSQEKSGWKLISILRNC